MFSVGMATFNDFDGVYFTTMSLLAHHGELVSEVLIVDNNPNGPVSQSLREFVQNADRRIRYVPYTEATGTAQPRNEVFRQARSEYVVCLDSHVLLLPGALAALHAAMKDDGLYHGPLVMDNMKGLATHFEDIWQGEMWGVWGYDERVEREAVFSIPAQGLGMFACRKDAWLGFNEQFRGFGGEEWYIHEKYRKAGRGVNCVSGAKWVHRFGRPNGIPYPLARYDRVRNYCIGLQELGIPLDRVQRHFKSVLKPGEWEAAVRGELAPPAPTVRSCGVRYASLDEWYEAVKAAPSDINEHCDTLRELAAGKLVVDCGSRHGVSTVALAAGKPSELYIVHPTRPAEIDVLRGMGVNVTWEKGTSTDIAPAACDLVFLDTEHTAEHVTAELAAWQGRAQRIIIHDTVTFPGVMEAVRGFLRSNKKWVAVRHDKHNNGLIVLSRDPADRKPLPSRARMAVNFAKAVASHVANGAKQVDAERYELRLAECDICPSRNGGRCGECGCPILDKAKWSEQRCPLEKW